MHFWKLELRNAIQELSFVRIIDFFKRYSFSPVVAPYRSCCIYYILKLVLGLGTFRLFWNRSVLGRGPSAKSFLSLSLFLYHSIMFRSVPFCSVLSRRSVFPFRSVPFLAFLFKKRFHPSRSVLSQRTFPSPLFRS